MWQKLKEKIKAKILTINIAVLYNTIDEDDILLRNKEGVWLVGGKPITEEKMRLIKSQAKSFINSALWKSLQKEIKYKSNEMMFLKAKSDIDITAGKLWLFTIDAINTKLKELTKDDY